VNLRDLQYLVAVADYRHFGEAAAACLVSQPTLSTQLKKLEAELGVELVERNPRHISLTEAGERIVEKARDVLGGVDAIQAIARTARDPESGTIRLGLIPTLAPYLLPHVVPAMHARFPRLELLLSEEKTDVLLDRLRDGRVDAAVLARPVNDAQLHEELLFAEDFLLAAPCEHPLAQAAGPVPTSVLADHEVLLLDEGHCLRDQALSVCHLVGAAERGGFRATSLETLRQMVAAGVGLTLLPRLAVQPPVSPSTNVRVVEFSEPVPRREIAMYWRRTSAYRQFLPSLAETLRELPAGLASASASKSGQRSGRPARKPVASGSGERKK
jgi:LysR family transcriptional regulator, hydrogen peroxide-inducible genes activator